MTKEFQLLRSFSQGYAWRGKYDKLIILKHNTNII